MIENEDSSDLLHYCASPKLLGKFFESYDPTNIQF